MTKKPSVKKAREKGGGRKPRTIAEEMQVRVWARAVFDLSGMSARELEVRFPPDARGAQGRDIEYDPPESSLFWARYLRGKPAPSKIRKEHSGLLLVDEVDKTFPGTASLFWHPLWHILRADMSGKPIDDKILLRVQDMIPEEAFLGLLGGRAIAPPS